MAEANSGLLVTTHTARIISVQGLGHGLRRFFAIRVWKVELRADLRKPSDVSEGIKRLAKLAEPRSISRMVGHVKDGPTGLCTGHIMAPTEVLLQNPFALGLPDILTVPHTGC